MQMTSRAQSLNKKTMAVFGSAYYILLTQYEGQSISSMQYMLNTALTQPKVCSTFVQFLEHFCDCLVSVCLFWLGLAPIGRLLNNELGFIGFTYGKYTVYCLFWSWTGIKYDKLWSETQPQHIKSTHQLVWSGWTTLYTAQKYFSHMYKCMFSQSCQLHKTSKFSRSNLFISFTRITRLYLN